MNALEMLLRRIRGAGAPDPAWQEHLAEPEAATLPPQDRVIPAPGQQTYSTQQGFAVGDEGIYSPNRTVPAGDYVMPAEQDWWRWRQGPDIPAMPRHAPKPGQQIDPNYLPGSIGFTRISAGQSLPRAGQFVPQELAARRAPQRENDLDANVRLADELKRRGLWPMPEGATPPRIGHKQLPPQDPFSSPLNQMLQRPPFGLY